MAVKKDPTELSQAEQDAAKHDAAKDAATEAEKQRIALSTGTEPAEDDDAQPVNKWPGSDEIQMFAYLLDTGLENLKKVADPKDGIAEDKLAGLLILERNGQNRTEYVKLLMKRLKIKDLKKELPQAGGPDYTNDQTLITDL